VIKILIISAVFSPEPVVSAKLSEDIANELSLSYGVTVLAPKPTRPFGFKLQKDETKSIKYSLINLDSFTCPESNTYGRLKESYSFGLACKKYISENAKNIDLIYMNSWPMFSQYFIVKTAKRYNIKVITHVQDVYPESLTNKIPKLSTILNFIFYPIDKFVLKNSYKIIAISNKMKHYLVETRNLEENSIEVVQNWQNEESFTSYAQTSTSKTKENIFTYMYLGNIGPVAGVDLIIDAFIAANISKSKLIIAGSGSKKEELQKKVNKSKVLNIEFLDVPDGKVPEIQDLADIMLLPIKKGAASSSIPSKLPAYMFSKKPIIGALDLDSDTARVILDSDCGWVVKPEDTSELKEKIIETFNFKNEELIHKGTKGFKYALKYLSKKNNLSQVTNIIKKPLL
jgi:glycosyltransferase involved in cell wall biosynthesis